MPERVQDGAGVRDSKKRVTEWAAIVRQDPDPNIVTDEILRQAIAGTGLPWHVRHRQTGIELLLVPAGRYERGASVGDREADKSESPVSTISITKAFYLGRYEVRQLEWSMAIGSNPSSCQIDPNQPVENVSWEEANEYFCSRRGLRLPTEAEWEYACRAGSADARYGPLDDVAWYDSNSDGRPQAVGAKRANEFGLHDMLGNVSEWCSDWYGDYTAGERADPTGPSTGSLRVIRGGSWNSIAENCRASSRGDFAPGVRDFETGFRVARDP